MFDIARRGSTPGREVLGGLTTFMAMSYILFVQPAVLKMAGMDSGGVFMATCIASAAACVLMGLLANLPVALAPGMGQNFFFVFTLCGTAGMVWQEGMALTVVTGLVFLMLSTVGFRSRVLNAIPDSLKSGIAAGIGLFIALIGLQWGNVVVGSAGTDIALAPMHNNYVAGLTLAGLVIILALDLWNVHGAILLGILATTALTWAVGALWGLPGVKWHGLVAMPAGLSETAGGFLHGFGSLWGKTTAGYQGALAVLAYGAIVLFLDMFDTIGTLVGVASRGGLMRSGRLDKAERALAADAAGTVVGAALGTSTVTSYIESITGVAAGARTGLAAIVSGGCLLAALFFWPLVEMVGGGVQIGVSAGNVPIVKYPMIAPALIWVGALMMRAMRDIRWDDPTEGLPAFLTMVVMPFGYSISGGIAAGLISYAVAKILAGRFRETPLVVYVFAAIFAAMYLFVM